MPRTEYLILLIGLACTIYGKLVVMRSYGSAGVLADLVKVVFPDVLFFAAVALVIRCIYILKPSVFVARCALLIAALLVIWSVFNTTWLLKSGVQLQPGILLLLVQDFGDLWPLVKAHVVNSLKLIVLLAMMAVGMCAIFLWCVIRPRKVVACRIHHIRWAVGLALVITGMLFVRPAGPINASSSFAVEVLDFSSHWYAFVSTIANGRQEQYSLQQTENIQLAGQRQIGIPKNPSSELPNVVLVLLESISYSVTSMSDPEQQTTPYLAHLARQGVEFRMTRVPVPYTTKAFWVVLTSIAPIIDTDSPETIPAETPYEGLASVLARAGYRSAFFEMSKGNFECAPGLFSNLAFDWAWFRENLEDPSAYIGYMGGDDCRIIKPAFEWAKKSERPFFMMMITSIAHDPYEVPDWFEKPKENLYEKYLQTVRYTDYFLEQLCKELRANGFDKNTLLCILGDHGTSFNVERARGRWVPNEEVIRVPWIIRWPGHIRQGQIIEWPCSQLDVTPTILELIGFDITNAGFEGKDAFIPSEPNRRLYFSSLLSNSPIGFVEGNRKVVYWPYLDKVFEYDLSVDPMEKNPRTVEGQQVVQIKRDISNWQNRSQIAVDAKRHTRRLLFSHWQTFSAGRSAWAYYVP